MSVIEDVKQRTDIVAVIGKYVTLTKAGRNYKAPCPFHTEKTPSFFVFPEKQTWHCFGACATGGDVFSFIMKKDGVDFGEALRILAANAGVVMPQRVEYGPPKEKKERLFELNAGAASFYHDLFLHSSSAASVRKYVEKRGLNASSILDFQIGYAPPAWDELKKHLMEKGYTEAELLEAGLILGEGQKTHDRFRNRLMFPIKEKGGNITGFGGRALDDSEPKYLNSPQTPVFDKSSTLYGIEKALPEIRKEDKVIIVEGYMDVILPLQYGFKNVVASMGTAITDKQVNIIKALTKNITMALDPDEAGKAAMLRCIEHENLLGGEIKVATLPEGKDPDELVMHDVEAWKNAIATAIPVMEFTIDDVLAKGDVSTALGKSAVTDQLLPHISKIENPVRRDHYLTELSSKAGIRYNILESALSQLSSAKSRQVVRENKTKPVNIRSGSPREEYCLSLLLKFPELKKEADSHLQDYFLHTEHREILCALTGCEDPAEIKQKLDASLWERVDALTSREMPPGRKEEKLADCILLLKLEHLRNTEVQLGEILKQERETGGEGADLRRLEQEWEGFRTSFKKGV